MYNTLITHTNFMYTNTDVKSIETYLKQISYRIFCGDLGNEVTDDTLTRVFTKYPSFQKARVVRDKNTMKSRGLVFLLVYLYL